MPENKPLFTKEQIEKIAHEVNQEQAEQMKKWEESKPEELDEEDKKSIRISRKQAEEGKLLSEKEFFKKLEPEESWEDKFDKLFPNVYDKKRRRYFYITIDGLRYIKSFIRSELQKSRKEAIAECDNLISKMYHKRANKPLDERSDGGWMLDELRENLKKIKEKI